MTSSLVITLRLKKATAHTHTRTHAPTHTHTHTNTMMSKSTVKTMQFSKKNTRKMLTNYPLRKIRNHSFHKCKWCLKYTMIKNSKINETCSV